MTTRLAPLLHQAPILEAHDHTFDGAPCIALGPHEWDYMSDMAPDEAKAWCAQCPAITACKDRCDNLEAKYITTKSIHLIWAGETPLERLKRRAAMSATAYKPLPPHTPAPTHCIIPWCGRTPTRRGFCQRHYQAWLRGGRPPKFVPTEQHGCDMHHCPNLGKTRGLCAKHYHEWLTAGQPPQFRRITIRGTTR